MEMNRLGDKLGAIEFSVKQYIRTVFAVLMIATNVLVTTMVWASTERYRLVWNANDDPATTMTVGWDQVSGTEPAVWYGTDSGGAGWVSQSPQDSNTWAGMRNTFAKLMGLQPDTAYYFEVRDTEGASETMWFKTAPDSPQEFTFVEGGDLQSDIDAISNGNKLIAKIRPLFVLLGGDYCYYGTASEFRQFFDIWQFTKSSDGRMYPVIPAHGNHENVDLYTVHYLFNTPEDCYYAVSIAGSMMRIWVLNSELQPGVGYNAFEGQTPLKWEAQQQWLADDMAANPNFIWKVANYHQPLRPHWTGKDEGIGRIAAWAHTFYENGLNLACEHHAHLAKYTYPLVPSEGLNSYESFVRDDADGMVFIGEGGWGAELRAADDEKPWTLDSELFWNFHLIHASPQNLFIRTIKWADFADVGPVVPLTQAEQDADPFALPQNLNLWQPLAGEVVTLYATGDVFRGADIDNLQYIGNGADWKYLDNGSDPGDDWKNPGFNDSGWLEGPSQLGFGDGDERTTIESGHITYYFRKNFTVQDASKVVELTMRILRDDGAVVYLNGTEVARSNVPEGNIHYTTLAEKPVTGGDETAYLNLTLVPELLTTGTNLIAVEVHQDDIASYDASFDLDLTGVISNVSGPVPTAPTSLTASIVEKNIQLEWNDNATDEKGYKILRKAGSGTWKVLEGRLPANTTTYTNMGLKTGEIYTYRVQAYNQYGISDSSNEVTETAPQQLAQNQLYFEGFEDGTFGECSTVSVSSNHDWLIFIYHGEHFPKMNGFGADEPSDDWLITKPFNLLPYSNVTVSCDLCWNYGGPELEMLVSTDYDPNVHVNPGDATWFDLNPELPPKDGYNWHSSGELDLTPYRAENVYIAWWYYSTGTESEDGRIWEVDNIQLTGEYNPQAIELEDFDFQTLGDWTDYSRASSANWHPENVGGHDAAVCDGLGVEEASDDWLISPPLTINADDYAELSFEYYYSGSGPLLGVHISQDYTGAGDPLVNGTWIDVPVDLIGNPDNWHASGYLDISTYSGSQVYVAFRYLSGGNGSGQGMKWGLDNIKINQGFLYRLNANFTAGINNYTTAEPVTVKPLVSGGIPPYSYEWNLGDGSPLVTDERPAHLYTTPGTYTVSLTVTDSAGRQDSLVRENYLTIIEATEEGIPVRKTDIRVATYNAYLNRAEPSALLADLSSPDDYQIQKVAEIIQRINPDVILINEFDYLEDNQAVDLFKSNYLEVSQNGAPPITFDYVFCEESNTGLPSGHDFNNDGQVGGPDDAYGFGEFPGQYGLVLLSKYPILYDQVRTFQKFIWKDMPGALLPFYPGTGGDPCSTDLDCSDGEICDVWRDDVCRTAWYSKEELEVFRLSSKSHWDVPVNVNGEVIHLLCSHPTPPAFDGVEKRNMKRNHDEIRLWADYTAYDQSLADYIYDDSGTYGGIGESQRFVIVGDQNADPGRGDSYDDAILQLLESGTVDPSLTPVSEGAREQGTDETDTASWGLRADYVLPSQYGFVIDQGAVFWPTTTDVLFHLVENDASSDHRLVWVDLYLLSGFCDSDEDCEDDGLFCNGDAYCVVTGGLTDRNLCRSSDDSPCGEGELCDEGLDRCVECLTDYDCSASQVCNEGVCEQEVVPECTMDDDCDDGNPCTADTCDAGVCLNDPTAMNGESCANGTGICNGGACKIQPGPGPSPGPPSECRSDAQCDDERFCNGVERCVDGTCQSGENPCQPELTGLMCDEARDACAECFNNAHCDDGLFCNGKEMCLYPDVGVPIGRCLPGKAPCTDDGLFCNGVEGCDELNDVCLNSGNLCPEGTICDEEKDVCEMVVPPPAILVDPDIILQSRWIPLLVSLHIEGSNTHFDSSCSIRFNPDNALMALQTLVEDDENISLVALVMPLWFTGFMDGKVEVTVTTGSDELTETFTMELLPFILDEDKMPLYQGGAGE